MNTSGSINNNNANNTNAVVPDYTNCQLKVSQGRNQNIVQGTIVLAGMAKINTTHRNSGGGSFYKNMEKENIKEKVCNFRNLYKALRISKKGVIWKDSIAKYVLNGLINCHRLIELVYSGEYGILPYTKFIIHCPKTRKIESTRIRDRVFQRSLCDNYLYHEITKDFIVDNCSSQKKKGTDFARNRLKLHLREFYSTYGNSGYCLRGDIKDFYGSTSHEIAKTVISQYVKDEWALNEVFRIIDSFNKEISSGKGMGLGSQITQLVQLALLDDMDHLIVDELGIHYIRYNDDFVLIHHDKDFLLRAKNLIAESLERRGLVLNKKKTQIFQLKQPIHFLGFSFLLHDTGKVTMKILPEKLSEERRRLKKQVALAKMGILTKEKVDFCYKSWRAYAKKGDSRGQLLKMDKYYLSLWE